MFGSDKPNLFLYQNVVLMKNKVLNRLVLKNNNQKVFI